MRMTSAGSHIGAVGRRATAWVILALPAVASVVLSAQQPPGLSQGETRPSTLPAGGDKSLKKWVRMIPAGTFVPTPKDPPPELPQNVEKAFVIPIHGPLLSSSVVDAIERKVAECKSLGAQMVIFDIDSPGGSTMVMQRIGRVILEDLENIRTVAYVNPEAISAAAIIALHCNEIVMDPYGKIGDSMPIMQGPGGQLVKIPDKERGKFESYMRGDLRSVIRNRGYNAAMCEAMVTIDRIIWLVRDRRTGELDIVAARDYRGQVSGVPQAKKEPKDARYEYLALIDGPMELVTLTAPEAKAAGFCRHVIDDMDELISHYNITAPPTYLGDNWSERLVRFLTSPVISGALFMGAIFFAYVEMHTPGFGVPGAIAIACFALMLGSRYLVGLAQWWEVAVLVIGILLVLAEIFIIPGFGIAGVLGTIFILSALAAIIIPNPPNKWPIPKTNLDWSVFANGLYAIIAAFICATIAAAVAARYLPKIPLASRLVLASAESTPEASVSETSPYRRVSAGDVGVVEATCRPVGKVRIGDDLLDAVSESGIIKAGRKVKVLRRNGNRLVVEEIQEA